MRTPSSSFPATAIIVIIFSGTIAVLSGLCTGFFAWEAEAGRGGDLMPRRWEHAVIWGSLAFIPAGLFLWSGLRQWRRGNNKISSILFLIGGLGGLALCLWSIVLGINMLSEQAEFRARTGQSAGYDNILIFWMIIVPSIGALTGSWFIFAGIKILRNLKPKKIEVEIFE